MAGTIGSNQASTIGRTFTGPGYLQFMWKVSSQPDADFLSLYLDGKRIAYRSGARDWLLEEVPIPPGSHTVTWEYWKDASVVAGNDAAYLDAVAFTTASQASVLTAATASTGGGAGRVISSPALIDCGTGSANRCQATLPFGEHVLFAIPATGSTLGSWSGCDDVRGAACVVNLAYPRTVTAQFQSGKSAEDTVQEAYMAYYGRPADLGGQQYWAQQLRNANGSLSAIIQSFGNSEEAIRLFGNMSNDQTVTTLYRQILGREPECLSYASTCGWGWWVNELASGRRTRQTIALDLLNGAQNEDRLTVNNRARAANAFTGQWAALDTPSNLTSQQVEALWRDYLGRVNSRSSSMEEAIFDAPGWAWKSVGY
jgi:hypothetical protein